MGRMSRSRCHKKPAKRGCTTFFNQRSNLAQGRPLGGPMTGLPRPNSHVDRRLRLHEAGWPTLQQTPETVIIPGTRDPTFCIVGTPGSCSRIHDVDTLENVTVLVLLLGAPKPATSSFSCSFRCACVYHFPLHEEHRPGM